MHNISLQDLYLNDSELLTAQQHTVDYLLSLDAKRFLYEFYRTANLTPITSEGYQGWERSNEINFRGHFFGHFLTALSQAIVESHQTEIQNELLEKLTTAISGLTYVLANSEGSPGYISAFREIALDEVEGYEVNQEERENVLVPWYNLDKVLAGLIATHVNLADIDHEVARQALDLANSFGLYVYHRMQRLPNRNQLLTIEYGAMNATLYDLFNLTNDYRHFEAATYFDEFELFEELSNDQDVLAEKHANTTIPKFLGALKHYQAIDKLLGDEAYLALNPILLENREIYLKAAINFWEIVVNNHTYVTGGNSQSEHFHQANQLYYDAENRQGDCTCETCNTYNMLRLSKELFKITDEKKYLDYFERTYINAILSSQHPETGMMMYFQPMGVGYNKVYNRPFDEFWCCTGTGIESFTKLSESIYFYDNDANTLLMNLYFSNTYYAREHNLYFETVVNRKVGKVSINVKAIESEKPTRMINLKLRLPNWAEQQDFEMNDQKQAMQNEDYWLATVMDGDVIKMNWQYKLAVSAAHDNPAYVAFTYGPYVLSSRLGKENIDAYHPNGILVRVGTQETTYQDYLTLKKKSFCPEALIEDYQVLSSPDRLFEIELNNVDEKIKFAPYYQAHNERYGIYYKIRHAQEMLAVNNENRTVSLVDLSLFDGNNSEYTHHLEQHKSEIGVAEGKTYRQANPGGAFSYRFDLKSYTGAIKVILTLHKEDVDSKLNCSIKGDTTIAQIIAPIAIETEEPWVKVEIEATVTTNEPVQISFSTDASSSSARLFGVEIQKVMHE